jgi:hypothetical protein
LGLKDGIITVFALPGPWMYLLNVHLRKWNVASDKLQQELQTNKQTGREDTEEKRAGLKKLGLEEL